MPDPELPQSVQSILLLTARDRLDDAEEERLCASAVGDVDWTALVQTALAHGTVGLLCRHLLTSLGDALPPDFRDAAAAYHDHGASLYGQGVAQLLDLLRKFSDAGIVAVPFKGPALAQMAYAEPALRGFRDLDILIAEADVDAVMAVLARDGYQSQYPDLRPAHRRAYHRYNGQDILFVEGRLPVEPHWQFGQRTLAAPLDVPGMLGRRVKMHLAGWEIAVLTPEDTLLTTAFHGSKEEWTSLRGIVDVAALLWANPSLDWDTVLGRASTAGVRRMLLLGIALARQMLDAPVPGPVLKLIAADPVITALVAEVRGRLFIPGATERSVFALSGFRWRMRERPRDRLAYALATMTTARVAHFQAVDLPDALGFLYPGVKVLHDYVALPLWLACRRLQGKTGDAANGASLE